VKIMCPHGHRVAQVTRDGVSWMIETSPDISLRLVDGTAIAVTRYPNHEPLHARPQRMLGCRRECMYEHSWYIADSAELERLAAAGIRTHRLAAC
jgi:hypothetical protein